MKYLRDFKWKHEFSIQDLTRHHISLKNKGKFLVLIRRNVDFHWRQHENRIILAHWNEKNFAHCLYCKNAMCFRLKRNSLQKEHIELFILFYFSHKYTLTILCASVPRMSMNLKLYLLQQNILSFSTDENRAKTAKNVQLCMRTLFEWMTVAKWCALHRVRWDEGYSNVTTVLWKWFAAAYRWRFEMISVDKLKNWRIFSKFPLKWIRMTFDRWKYFFYPENSVFILFHMKIWQI